MATYRRKISKSTRSLIAVAITICSIFGGLAKADDKLYYAGSSSIVSLDLQTLRKDIIKNNANPYLSFYVKETAEYYWVQKKSVFKMVAGGAPQHLFELPADINVAYSEKFTVDINDNIIFIEVWAYDENKNLEPYVLASRLDGSQMRKLFDGNPRLGTGIEIDTSNNKIILGTKRSDSWERIDVYDYSYLYNLAIDFPDAKVPSVELGPDSTFTTGIDTTDLVLDDVRFVSLKNNVASMIIYDAESGTESVHRYNLTTGEKKIIPFFGLNSFGGYSYEHDIYIVKNNGMYMFLDSDGQTLASFDNNKHQYYIDDLAVLDVNDNGVVITTDIGIFIAHSTTDKLTPIFENSRDYIYDLKRGNPGELIYSTFKDVVKIDGAGAEKARLIGVDDDEENRLYYDAATDSADMGSGRNFTFKSFSSGEVVKSFEITEDISQKLPTYIPATDQFIWDEKTDSQIILKIFNRFDGTVINSVTESITGLQYPNISFSNQFVDEVSKTAYVLFSYKKAVPGTLQFESNHDVYAVNLADGSFKKLYSLPAGNYEDPVAPLVQQGGGKIFHYAESYDSSAGKMEKHIIQYDPTTDAVTILHSLGTEHLIHDSHFHYGVLIGSSQDLCPEDPNKSEPGACGCDANDTDYNANQKADCTEDNLVIREGSPQDEPKIIDTQSKNLPPTPVPPVPTVPTPVDDCPEDAAKTAPGICGCGVADVDADNSGIIDCKVGNETVNLLTILEDKANKLMQFKAPKSKPKTKSAAKKLKARKIAYNLAKQEFNSALAKVTEYYGKHSSALLVVNGLSTQVGSLSSEGGALLKSSLFKKPSKGRKKSKVLPFKRQKAKFLALVASMKGALSSIS